MWLLLLFCCELVCKNILDQFVEWIVVLCSSGVSSSTLGTMKGDPSAPASSRAQIMHILEYELLACRPGFPIAAWVPRISKGIQAQLPIACRPGFRPSTTSQLTQEHDFYKACSVAMLGTCMLPAMLCSNGSRKLISWFFGIGFVLRFPWSTLTTYSRTHLKTFPEVL